MESAAARCHVLAVPYPGRGHVNPMMSLCEHLATRGVAVTFVVTDEWLGLLQSTPVPAAVALRSIPNVIPSEHDRAADFAGFIDAVNTKMEAPFESLLDELQSPVSCIVADTYLTWAAGVGNRRNIPVASLWTMAPSMFSIIYHLDLCRSHGHYALQCNRAEEERVEYIPGIASISLSDVRHILRLDDLRLSANSPSVLHRAVGSVLTAATEAHYLLFTTPSDLDSPAIDALSSELRPEVFALGPACIPYTNKPPHSPSPAIAVDPSGEADYVSWLDDQPPNSVLYVSLGSFLGTSASQMDEIVKGLGESGVRFLWVGRGDAQRLQAASGESGERGLVVPWCDQLRVLSHASVGGFLTHCGWNSTMEAAFSGVPMLAFPLFWDQFPNSRLIVEAWGVGLRLRREAEGGDLIKSEEIALLVKRLMELDGGESREMRRKARKLQEACRRAAEEGGSAQRNLDEFVKHLMKQNCSE